MRAILITRCGCTREIDIPYLKPTVEVAVVPRATDGFMLPMERRVFELSATSEDFVEYKEQ